MATGVKQVVGERGTVGLLAPRPDDPVGKVTVRRSDGSDIVLDWADLTEEDGAYRLAQQDDVIPVVAEQFIVGKRAVATGGVRVHKLVHEHDEVLSMPLKREMANVRRVVINREVDGPLPVREEGGTVIIPVVEEVLVWEKRYVLKEELHIAKHVVEERVEQAVTLRREEAEVERVDAEGRPVPEAVDPTPGKRRSKVYRARRS